MADFTAAALGGGTGAKGSMGGALRYVLDEDDEDDEDGLEETEDDGREEDDDGRE